MIKIEDIDVYGWEPAIRGMRNPMNSWDKSDTIFDGDKWCLGENDLKLMQQLSAAGNDHAKFLRMINVTMDITAPLYWWSEFDTYKVGTVRNSCSKMHKIHIKEFSHNDFSHESIYSIDYAKMVFVKYCSMCERLRKDFNKIGDVKYWKALIEALPEGYNMCATVQLNYQVLKSMYWARRNHKLDEWKYFCVQVEFLPYFADICMEPVSYKHV